MHRLALATLVLAGLGGAAAADTFAGFSGFDKSYLVGPDRLCAPLTVTSAKATGVPKCEKAASDKIAQLSIKTPTAERGAKARFTASSSGRNVTIKSGDRDVVVVEWTGLDPITRVDAVYASQYADMVAVEVVVRRSGREATDVVAFDLGVGHGGGDTTDPDPGPDTNPDTNPHPDPTGTAPPPADKAMTTALTKARKTSGKKAITAWTAVLTLDPDASEALYGLAAAQVKTGAKADAIKTLEKLAASTRTDAVEYRVAARFDKAFAKVRADTGFRAAVGLDQAATSIYERVMGFGGTWEQLQVCGQNPAVKLTLTRDHKFKLGVSSKCSQDSYGWTFKGAWQVDTVGLLLTFPNGKDRKEETTRCTLTASGDEDSIKCPVDEDLEFTVLPVRR